MMREDFDMTRFFKSYDEDNPDQEALHRQRGAAECSGIAGRGAPHRGRRENRDDLDWIGLECRQTLQTLRFAGH
jgi:hypothetical protein